MIRWGSSACALGAPAWPRAGYTGGLLLATINTLILVTSSLTMVRTTLFARRGDHDRVRKNLLATLILGTLFLTIKGCEYALKIHHGYFPRSPFMQENPGLVIFISFYFALTGLHGLHVIAGLLWNGALYRAMRQGWRPDFRNKLEYAGLYWHFVDVLWLFLFPLFYLI
jgi:heme/copper-type cytochrome/quinol oxidase subunit 3